MLFLEINRDTILKEGNPVLNQVAKEIEFPLSSLNLQLIRKMENYLYDSNDEDIAKNKNLEPAIGIAAPQIGVSIRLFLLLEEKEDGVYTKVVINPTIVKKSSTLAYLSTGEGCLSVPKLQKGNIYRPYEIEVEYFNIEGEKIVEDLKGFDAISFQHEFDHLEGKLYTSYIKKEDPYYKIEGSIEI